MTATRRRGAQGLVALPARVGLHLRAPCRRCRRTWARRGSSRARLHGAVVRVPPVVREPTPEEAIADLNVLSLPGTAVFAAACCRRSCSACPLGWCGSSADRRPAGAVAPGDQLHGGPGLRDSLLRHGHGARPEPDAHRRVFPFFGTLLGWLGVALTGTDAGSNALFGNLQKVTAERLGLEPGPDGLGQFERRSDGEDDRRPVDRRRQHGDTPAGARGRDFKAVIGHSVVLAGLVGLIVTLYAFVLPGWIPQVPAK